jgi:hypothetical protein
VRWPLLKPVRQILLAVLVGGAALVQMGYGDARGLPAPQSPSKDAVDQVKEVSTDQLKAWMNSHRAFLLIDVREMR